MWRKPSYFSSQSHLCVKKQSFKGLKDYSFAVIMWCYSSSGGGWFLFLRYKYPFSSSSIISITTFIIITTALFQTKETKREMSKQFAGKLHGSVSTTCTKRVLLTGLELGVTIPVKEIDFINKEHKQEAHLSIQVILIDSLLVFFFVCILFYWLAFFLSFPFSPAPPSFSSPSSLLL